MDIDIDVKNTDRTHQIGAKIEKEAKFSTIAKRDENQEPFHY